ncbi:MAG: hypothetical protein AAF748_07015 [Pseudomonadota bacterium]
MRFFVILAGLGAGLAAGIGQAVAQSEWTGFCGNYVQTTSNAGQCVNCRLLIADNPETQRYFVEADTGWSAELEWLGGDPSAAAGDGRWGTVGGVYDQQPFTIDMSAQGDVLYMTMGHADPSLGVPIESTYVCLDQRF